MRLSPAKPSTHPPSVAGCWGGLAGTLLAAPGFPELLETHTLAIHIAQPRSYLQTLQTLGPNVSTTRQCADIYSAKYLGPKGASSLLLFRAIYTVKIPRCYGIPLSPWAFTEKCCHQVLLRGRRDRYRDYPPQTVIDTQNGSS